MNPALMNYVQSQQQNNPEMQAMQNPMGQLMQQQQPMQQSQPQSAPNPFDSGIRKAIESARESMGMTDKQQDRAMRSSMLAFGNDIGQQPKQRGFWNNFGTGLKALGPAIETHDQEEAAAEGQNNAMAQQILAYQAAEQKAAQDQEEREWHRGHAEAQLGEQRRYHDLVADSREGSHNNKTDEKENVIGKMIENARTLVTQSEDDAHRGYAKRFFNKFIPGGVRLTTDQAAVESAGELLQGLLFNKFRYRNRAEFERIPLISADNTKEVNLEIIKQYENLLKEEDASSPQARSRENSQVSMTEEGHVLMQGPDGTQYNVPLSKQELFEQEGYTVGE